MCSGSCPHRHTPPPEPSFSLRRAIFTSIPIVVVLILLPAIAFATLPTNYGSPESAMALMVTRA